MTLHLGQIYDLLIRSFLMIIFATQSLTAFGSEINHQNDEQSTVEKVGGEFVIEKIKKLKPSGFEITFAPVNGPAEITAKKIILTSEHLHVGLKEGDEVRLSANVQPSTQKNSKNISVASQVLIYRSKNIPNAGPLWMVARGAKIRLDQNFLKMHSPATDYTIL